jgi:HD-GYP domain-containing protein (c-di-GMP phosphodiesterase class II)
VKPSIQFEKDQNQVKRQMSNLETTSILCAQMLSPIQYLKLALDIPYCHHEHWDGTGYPRRLKGEQIPLTARIFAIADVYDALTSDRPYRPKWAEADVIAYISQHAESFFDPQIVTVFLQMVEENQFAGTVAD